jgi:D-arabinose 1-dehydrogenase-like Zn-dependent alcohol dehydrogenase
MYLKLTAMDGEMAALGLPLTANTPTVDIASPIWSARRKVYGSQIGGIRETQEVIDYSKRKALQHHRAHPNGERVGVKALLGLRKRK